MFDGVLTIVCSCGTRFEAHVHDPQIIGAARDHQVRCGDGLEWWLSTPTLARPDEIPHISPRYEP